MKIGYAAGSPDDSQHAAHLQRLNAAGCNNIFSDTPPPKTATINPGLAHVLSQLSSGDILVVPTLKHLAHRVADLRHILEQISTATAFIQCLDDGADSPIRDPSHIILYAHALSRLTGQRIVNPYAPLASHAGRPATITPKQLARADRLIKDRKASRKHIAASLGVALSTLDRNLATYRKQKPLDTS